MRGPGYSLIRRCAPGRSPAHHPATGPPAHPPAPLICGTHELSILLTTAALSHTHGHMGTAHICTHARTHARTHTYVCACWQAGNATFGNSRRGGSLARHCHHRHCRRCGLGSGSAPSTVTTVATPQLPAPVRGRSQRSPGRRRPPRRTRCRSRHATPRRRGSDATPPVATRPVQSRHGQPQPASPAAQRWAARARARRPERCNRRRAASCGWPAPHAAALHIVVMPAAACDPASSPCLRAACLGCMPPAPRRRSPGSWPHLLDLPAQHTLGCQTLCEHVQCSRVVRTIR